MAESDEFPVGSCVILKDLKASYLNGRKGKVASLPPNARKDHSKGCVGVDLFNPWTDPQTGVQKQEHLAIKAENLQIDHTNLQYVEQTSALLTSCYNCQKQNEHNLFLVCSKCRVAQYCSKDCQGKVFMYVCIGWFPWLIWKPRRL